MLNSIQNLNRLPNSKKSISKIPEEPGIYVFYKNDFPIYIGKAINLRNRLSSYFSTNLAPKTARMVSTATDIAFIKVESELDSLLLEAKLVHDLLPQYNAALRDDKHPLYIRITKELYPRVLTARKISENEPNLAFYGPFPSSSSVRSVLHMLRRVFPFSDHKIGSRACLYSHIGLCKPCPNFIEKIEDVGSKIYERKRYLKNINQIKKVLERKTDSVISDLRKKMGLYSKLQNFEAAAATRDQLKRLEYISQPILPTSGFLENPNLVEDLRNEELKDLSKLLTSFGGAGYSFLPLTSLSRIECFDIAHLAGVSPTASMVTFVDGVADKNFYRHFKIRQIKGNDDISSLTEVITRRVKYLTKGGRPNLIIVDGGKGQVSAFNKILSNYNIPVVGIAKSFETLIIQKSNTFVSIRLKDSPALHLVQRMRDEAHRFARRYHHKLLQRDLLPK